MNYATRLFILLLSVLALQATSKAKSGIPYGLRTDLIENTEYYSRDGYLTKLSVLEAQADTAHFRAAWIRTAHPSFGWIVQDCAKGVTQSFFRLIVSDNAADIKRKHGNIYDSGVQKSQISSNFLPENLKLEPSRAYYWRVLVGTNKDSRGKWSKPKLFRTFSQLNDSATSYEPLMKTRQTAKIVKTLPDGSKIADFELHSFAQPLLEISAAENAKISVFIGEKLSADGHVDMKPGGTIRAAEYTLNVEKGKHLYRIDLRPDKRNTGPDAVKIPDFIGEITPFRYCEVKNAENTVKSVNFIRETVNYPLDSGLSAFESDNDTLNRVFNFCKYSLKATSMMGIYVDGDRERIAYEADALVSMLGTYFCFGDAAMSRRTVRHLLTHPTWPTEWSMQTVELAAYDYLFTGDSRLAKQNYSALEAHTLSALRDENGLISTFSGQTPEFLKSVGRKEPLKDISDWPGYGAGLNEPDGGERDGFVMGKYNAVVNAWHHRTLKRMVTLSQACALKDKALHYNQTADEFREKYNLHFLGENIYRDDIDTDHSSVHSNFYPAAFGIVPAGKSKKVCDYILKRGMACSAFGAQFLIDGLFRQGHGAEGIKFLISSGKRSWLNMLRKGATITMEDWDEEFKPNLDWNHAWATAPANIAFRDILGIIPTGPAYSVFMVFPQIGNLKRVVGHTMTLKGMIREKIRVKGKTIKFEIEVPANAIADISLPCITADFSQRRISRAKVDGKPVPVGRLTAPNASYTLGSGKHTVILYGN